MKTVDRIWIIILVLILVSFAGVTVYSGMWPPVSVVESSSMQHSDSWTSGAINTVDIVFVKKVTDTQTQVTTYLNGSKTGYSTYGEFGSVILYRSSSGNVVIHRPMFYLTWKGSMPVVSGYDNQSWINITSNYVLMKDVGYSHRNLLIILTGMVGESGFITVGDHNLAMKDTEQYHSLIESVGVNVITPEMRAFIDEITNLRRETWASYIVTGGTNVFVPVEKKNIREVVNLASKLKIEVVPLKVSGGASTF